MRQLFTAIGLLAAAAFIVASCWMNFDFWFEQGRSAREGYIFGAVSLAADLFKALLPVFIAGAFAARRYFYALGGTAFFAVCVCAALISSIGFISTNRGEHTGTRESLNARLSLAQNELNDLAGRISRLTGYPPTATIEANIKAMQQDKRWVSSAQCEDATVVASRDFCKEFFASKAQLSSAIEANRLTSRRDALVIEIRRLREAGAGQDADPQATLFAKVISAAVPGFDVSDARAALMLFFSILVELGAAFGLFLATRHGLAANVVKAAVVAEQPKRMPVEVTAPTRSAPRRRLGNYALSKPAAAPPPVIDLQPQQPKRFVVDDAAMEWASGK